MKVTTIKTRRLNPPQDNLLEVLEDSIENVPEKSVLAITSKVISIWEGSLVHKDRVSNKDELIATESDKYLPRDISPNGWVMHTIKNNLLIPSAGVDESNCGEYYALWPKNSKASAYNIAKWVKERFKTREFGVIITDSHTMPLRRGTIGISLGHVGFRPVNDYRNTNDLFDRKMRISMTDVADGLAASAVLAMGEGNECTPAALITDMPFVTFGDFDELENDPYTSHQIPEKEDVYYPLLSNMPWKKGGGGAKGCT